jgi:Tfp pilus assembly major pilin PilA
MSDLRGVLAQAGVTGKLIDKTPVNNNIRGAQIAEWIDNQNKRNDKVEQFIILDDDSDMGNLIKYLIKTSHADGLQDHHAELAIKRLTNIEGL